MVDNPADCMCWDRPLTLCDVWHRCRTPACGTFRTMSHDFPSPWSVEELDGCIIVWDRNGQALTYVYFEDDPRRRSVAKLLTRDDARQIAANIARLPSLLGLDV